MPRWTASAAGARVLGWTNSRCPNITTPSSGPRYLLSLEHAGGSQIGSRRSGEGRGWRRLHLKPTPTPQQSSSCAIGSAAYVGSSASSIRVSSSSLSTTVPPTPKSDGEILQSANGKSFAFRELRAATWIFRPDSVLGKGSLGPHT